MLKNLVTLSIVVVGLMICTSCMAGSWSISIGVPFGIGYYSSPPVYYGPVYQPYTYTYTYPYSYSYGYNYYYPRPYGYYNRLPHPPLPDDIYPGDHHGNHYRQNNYDDPVRLMPRQRHDGRD